MSRVARDRVNREDMMITSLKTWCDDIDMLTAFWRVDVQGLRCHDVPVLIEKKKQYMTNNNNNNNFSTKEIEDEKVVETSKRSNSVKSTNDVTLDEQLSLTSTDFQKDHSSDEELADDYDDDEEEEEKDLQYSGNDKKYAKKVKRRALKSLRKMSIPIAKMHAETCCAKCKRRLYHEIAYVMFEFTRMNGSILYHSYRS